MKTVMTTKEAGIAARTWYVLDAEDAVLGRLATKVAGLLTGKHKVSYVPHEDTGDFVIIVNASKVRMTGSKLDGKVYRRHTGHPGGIREKAARVALSDSPEKLIHRTIVGMLPRNRLGRKLATKLKVYADAQHPHTAQQPQPLPWQ